MPLLSEWAIQVRTEDDRVELIEAEIVEVTPIGCRRQVCVDRLVCRFAYAGTVQAFESHLRAIVDPEETDRRARAAVAPKQSCAIW